MRRDAAPMLPDGTRAPHEVNEGDRVVFSSYSGAEVTIDEATMRAIKAVKPGRQLSVVGRVIESYANRFGYTVVRDFTGHGIGETFHNGLIVLHYDEPNVDTVLEPGMVFTIEPMINLGALPWEMWDDGWTVVTADRRWTAQFEHTLVVTDDGAEILTVPDN